jgi:CBS-domain-containing membrane protein
MKTTQAMPLLDRAFRIVTTVPKEGLLKEEAKLKRLRQRKRAEKSA